LKVERLAWIIGSSSLQSDVERIVSVWAVLRKLSDPRVRPSDGHVLYEFPQIIDTAAHILAVLGKRCEFTKFRYDLFRIKKNSK
jgi:hypothetical protein